MYYRYIRILVIFLFIFCLMLSRNAYAYLDPGTGSYILQILIASLVAGIFAVKMFWVNIKLFLKKLFEERKKR